MPSFPSKLVTIATSASLSSAVELGGGVLCGIIMPSGWTAASITMQASNDGVNYYNLYDETGGEITYTVDVSRYIKTSPSEVFAVPYIKLRSGTSASAVVQEAERVLQLIVR